jgi:hypothetical protein
MGSVCRHFTTKRLTLSLAAAWRTILPQLYFLQQLAPMAQKLQRHVEKNVYSGDGQRYGDCSTQVQWELLAGM